MGSRVPHPMISGDLGCTVHLCYLLTALPTLFVMFHTTTMRFFVCYSRQKMLVADLLRYNLQPSRDDVCKLCMFRLKKIPPLTHANLYKACLIYIYTIGYISICNVIKP